MSDQSTSSSQQPSHLLLGEILRPHGIRGELRMRVLTDYPERITTLERIFLGNPDKLDTLKSYTVEHMRMHKGYGLLKLQDVNTRNDAELFRQLFVMIDLENAIPLEDDEIYLYQLIGLKIITEDDITLGTITDVLETGANDVYIIDSPQYGEVLFPATEDNILETNVEDGFILVRIPEGLLPNS